ncbi:MAG: hypothetical protein Q8N47_04190 [Bryobacterales bacterium]|nr:hypothetical protein [Bryobacterales bacterium]
MVRLHVPCLAPRNFVEQDVVEEIRSAKSSRDDLRGPKTSSNAPSPASRLCCAPDHE